MGIHVDETDQLERINRLRRIGGILISPKATLEEVARRPDWILPWLFLLIWPVVIAPIFASALTGSMVLVLARSVGVMAALWVIESGVIWYFGRASGGKVRFYSLYSVLGYAFFPAFIRGALTSVLMLFRISFLSYTSLSFLLYKMGSMRVLGALYGRNPIQMTVVSMIIGSIDMFSLWSFYLVFLGVRSVFGFGVGKAAAFAFLYWIIYIGFFVTMALIKL